MGLKLRLTQQNNLVSKALQNMLTNAERRTSNEHRYDGEDLLGVGVWRHVAEADTGQACTREIQRGDVSCHAGKAVH